MEEHVTQEVDLREVIRILRERLLLLIIIPFLAVTASALISSYYLIPVYRSTASLMVWEYYPDAPDYQDLYFNNYLLTTYREIAKSRMVAEKAANRLETSLSPGQLRGKVDVHVVEGTGMLFITAYDSNPQLAADIANGLAAALQEIMPPVFNMDNLKLIDEALVPGRPVSPNHRLNMTAAAVVGLMSAVVLSFYLEFLDTTIKKPEQVQRYLEFKVLGVIPLVKETRGKEN
ncbi:YveK family protein [Candidatus Contubernalis alkaliaceticus]|uniref:YveK family protein n=1 Tax=Candidatus Contubernalis alkaliaceticus TaxID=338645 RepID=UPI001F4C1DEC|nr:Wzz/FepE/Etk N-terminal domain-containing protein [Candidatus Contubernalis alkalaceticus]UNC93593.1 lipopolysaccharide biosynthesis protein [Candidatus Contubernalis alkalaceticus]